MFDDQRMRAAGKAAEDDACWYIDRTLGKSKNWKILHDVILFDKKGDCWCQIDHLVFGRLGYFLVLETKSSKQGMSLDKTTGAWSVWYDRRRQPIKSPVIQNERHIEVLKDFLQTNKVMPRRLGLPVSASFTSWILIEPGCSLPKEYGGAQLVQRDHFEKSLDAFIAKIGISSILRIMGVDEHTKIYDAILAESEENKRVRTTAPIVRRQEQIAVVEPVKQVSEEVKYGPSKDIVVTPPQIKVTESGKYCIKCEVELSHKEAAYCRFNFAKLGRQYLCRKCQ